MVDISCYTKVFSLCGVFLGWSALAVDSGEPQRITEERSWVIGTLASAETGADLEVTTVAIRNLLAPEGVAPTFQVRLLLNSRVALQRADLTVAEVDTAIAVIDRMAQEAKVDKSKPGRGDVRLTCLLGDGLVFAQERNQHGVTYEVHRGSVMLSLSEKGWTRLREILVDARADATRP